LPHHKDVRIHGYVHKEETVFNFFYTFNFWVFILDFNIYIFAEREREKERGKKHPTKETKFNRKRILGCYQDLEFGPYLII
jgi:hypothetical protein